MAVTRRSVLEYYYTDNAGATIGWIEAQIYPSKSAQKTTINESFTATDTTLTVASGSVFAVNDVIQIEDELLYITAISSNDLTVSRAFNGTKATSHANTTPIYTAVGINPVLKFDLTHTRSGPMIANVTLSNPSRDLWSTTPDVSHLNPALSARNGPFHDAFDNFKVIRVRDSYSKVMFFYGVVIDTHERHDDIFGQQIEIFAEDYLLELRENTLQSHANYRWDNSENIYASLQLADENTPVSNNINKQYPTGISSHGGMIKTLISHVSHRHIDVPHNAEGGNDKRFTESALKFGGVPATKIDGKVYHVGKRRRKNVLAHIEELAAKDKHAVNSPDKGYDFYLDHNITSTALTGINPLTHKMYFNYFKRGTRPNPNEDVARYGLNVEYPSRYSNYIGHSSTGTATNYFVEEGRRIPMLQYDFGRPKEAVFTSADVDYVAKEADDDGDTVLDVHHAKFECIEIKAGTAVDEFKWDGLTIGEGAAGTASAEYLKYNTASEGATPVWQQVGRIQWVDNATTSGGGDFTTADPTRKILISDIPFAALNNDNIWAEDAVWVGETTTGSQVTVKRVPRLAFAIAKCTHIVGASADDHDAVRESVATVLGRNSEEVVEGSFTTYSAPVYYIDNSPSAINSTSGTTQTFTLGNSVNPQDYGITIGMCVSELDSSSNPTSTYGYLSAVTTTTVTVTWATGGVGTDSTVRYYIPVRAGDSIHVRNDQYKFVGTMLVDKIEYLESTGVSETVFHVSGVDNTALNIARRIGETTKINMASHFADNATSLVVDDSSSIASDAVLLLDTDGQGELVEVTANNTSTNTLTVERKYLDTPAVQHNDNTSVYVVTKELASSGLRKSISSFVGYVNEALGNKDELPKQEPGEIDPSTVSITTNFIEGGNDQVNWEAGTIGYRGQVINISAGNTDSTMVSAANGNTGQATDGTSGDLAAGVKYIVYYDGNLATSATTYTGVYRTIRSAAYGALASTKNGTNIIVAYVQQNTGGAVFNVVTRGSADPTKMLDNRLVQRPNGSKTAPAYGFSDSNTTGMFRSASNTVGFSAAGELRVEIKSANFIAYRDDESTHALNVRTSDGLVSFSSGDVSGALSKGSGTFKIDHPVDKDNKYLYHGFIEGPNYDLLYRGKVTLVGGTATVNIDTVSNMTAGTFVALTQNPDYYLQNNTGWDAVKGSISGNILTITCQNSSSTDTISWMVVAERADDHIKATQLSDSDGHLIPEWNKSDID